MRAVIGLLTLLRIIVVIETLALLRIIVAPLRRHGRSAGYQRHDEGL